MQRASCKQNCSPALGGRTCPALTAPCPAGMGAKPPQRHAALLSGCTTRAMCVAAKYMDKLQTETKQTRQESVGMCLFLLRITAAE